MRTGRTAGDDPEDPVLAGRNQADESPGGTRRQRRHRAPKAPVSRIMAGVLIFQLGLCALLFAGDLSEGLRLPGWGPRAPEFQLPTSPGDQTRRYDPRDLPATQPAGPDSAPSGPMPDRLVLRREGADWRLIGTIAPGDADRIIRQMEAAADPETPIEGTPEGTPAPVPTRVLLNSPGGSVGDALRLGRHLRQSGLDTALRASDVCLSACPYLLAAGTRRMAEPGARIGVHQHYFGENTLLPAFTAVSDVQRGQGLVMQYLDDMGVDTMIMTHALVTPPDEIYLLEPEELEDYGLLTEPMARL
tara:strand:+ start:245145 stop:246053 length:909 start_codon:yes stop_codon:yes gene_type:complete